VLWARAQDKTTLDNAMAAAMNDVIVENANASAPMSEKQMEDQLMKAALTELNQAGSGVTVGWVHSILMMLALMIVAGVVYVLYAKSEYGACASWICHPYLGQERRRC